MFKKLLLTLLIFISIPIVANGSTVISGDIGAIIFNTKNNPYIVEHDIIVPQGMTVTIPEGIVILFHPFTGFRVEGRLNVRGTEENLVIFTSINDKTFNPQTEFFPNPFDWNGILVTKDSEGAFMNNFSLKYSVYGVKSQCMNIIIQNAIFQQNGQFNFTVNEQIKPVVDNIPFSYKDPSDSTRSINLSDTGNNPKDSMVSDLNRPDQKKRKKIAALRFSFLGVGLAGGVTATMVGVQMCMLSTDMNEFSCSGEILDAWAPAV
jgi:hypothetical protein